MENKEFKRIFLPKRLAVKKTDKAVLWKLPEMKGEADKYFWVSLKLVHKIGKDYVLNYLDDYHFTVFEQVKNEQGYFEKTNLQEVTGEELKGIYAEYDSKIEKSYLKWKRQNEE